MIHMLLYIYAFIIGCCVASFVNVVIYRLPRSLSIMKGRSMCPHCKRTLVWYELIPILSYLGLKGKCRTCKSVIPFRDTLLEVFGGLIGMFCYYRFGFHMETLFIFIICMIFVAITWIDLDTMTIPNGILIVFALITFLYCLIPGNLMWSERVIGFFCISLPMYGLTLLIQDCFGGGDIKLIAIGGWLLGWKGVLLAAFIAILIAGSYAIYLLLTKRVDKGGHIAFGPYLCIGMVIALCYGSTIIKAYLSFFGLT